MPVRSGWLLPLGQTRQNTRITNIGATTPINPLGVRSGILPGTYDGKFRLGGLWMSGAGPMTATVYHGRAVIQGGNSDGAYPVAVDQDMTITFGDGDPLHPRIDLVVLRVYDNDADLQGKYDAVVEIVKGEPKAAPVAPEPPARSLVLFGVKVKAGASAGTGGIDWTASGTVTDLRTTTVAAGGILPVYNNAAVAGSYPGQYQDNDNAHCLQRWDGTTWVAYPKEIGGIAPSGTVSAGGYTGQFRDNNGSLQRWNGTTWVNYQPPVENEATTTGVTALANWSVVSFYARRTKSGLCTMTVTVTRTGPQVDANSAGNINDEPLCVLPAGWRPALSVEASACDGFGNGGANVTTSGQIDLRTWSANGALAANRNIRISATYILP
ncbi:MULTISPECIES: hypothetical protein [Streptomyces]|uniref:hypothetical protein n=1 Tax=Streptomyces TaxID=1883 RepID=UPI001317C700|nr:MULTISPECIES: hypothetical protein [Streptomyces]QGZ50426.1 hypothetical protein GPZ77_20495 [Streptomyces sp. QHH-9511]GGT88348.1 hypothetical protein GCM10010272_36450 [Streptomyces lateritius]